MPKLCVFPGQTYNCMLSCIIVWIHVFLNKSPTKLCLATTTTTTTTTKSKQKETTAVENGVFLIGYLKNGTTEILKTEKKKATLNNTIIHTKKTHQKTPHHPHIKLFQWERFSKLRESKTEKKHQKKTPTTKNNTFTKPNTLRLSKRRPLTASS